MNAVHCPDDSLISHVDMILLVNGFLGSFNVIDDHDGLGLLLQSRVDPVPPLLVNRNTNSRSSVGSVSVSASKLFKSPEIMLPISSSFKFVLAFI